MSRPTASSEKSFGYLTAVETAEFGYFGGYLVISQLGRPLEFHCTAPIQPSRAQRILYGPTLEQYLLGEQICGALLGVAKLVPEVILTDSDTAISSRSRFAIPMIRLRSNTSMPATVSENDACGGCKLKKRITAHPPGASATDAGDSEFSLGPYQINLPYGFESDQRLVEEALTLLSQRVDLAEPFARIREAIGEAQRLGGKGTDAHGQAA
jgi:hypothetical protein